MENEEKMPLFTRLNDAIDGKIDAATQYIAKAAEDKEGISDAVSYTHLTLPTSDLV